MLVVAVIAVALGLRHGANAKSTPLSVAPASTSQPLYCVSAKTPRAETMSPMPTHPRRLWERLTLRRQPVQYG